MCPRPTAVLRFDSARAADTHVDSLRMMLTARGTAMFYVVDEEGLPAEVVQRDVSPVTSVGAGRGPIRVPSRYGHREASVQK